MKLPRAFPALLVLAAATPLAAGAPVPVQQRGESVVEAVRSTMRGTTFDAAALRDKLRAAGPDAPRAVFELLLEGEVDGLELSPAQRVILGHTLRSLPLETLRGSLATLARSQRPTAELALALELLGDAGCGQDLDLALRLAAPASGDAAVEPRLRRELDRTLSRILRREPAATARLPKLLRTCPPTLAYALCRAVGERGAEGGLTALARSLDAVDSMDPIVLVELIRCARRTPEAADELARSAVRARYAHEEDPDTLVLTAQASLALDDREAIFELVPLLSAGVPSVADAAHRALVELTGLTWDAEPETWATWLREEQLWWERDYPRCQEHVASGSLGEAAEGIRELSLKRIYPDEATAALLPALERREAVVVVLACRVLATRGGRGAICGLMGLLDHPATSVRTEAWFALQRITGLSFPLDPAPWRDRFPGC
ncbi:MAG: hypothetical protein AAF682_10095 [Planctomycetota bacterium]